MEKSLDHVSNIYLIAVKGLKSKIIVTKLMLSMKIINPTYDGWIQTLASTIGSKYNLVQ